MRATPLVPVFIGASLCILLQAPVANGQKTTRVSVDSAGTEADADSFTPVISADGGIVAFSSLASNLVDSDLNDTYDVFVHDRTTGTTVRVSLSSSGEEGNSTSVCAGLSDDGRLVAFYSWASNLVDGDTNAVADVFVHDRVTRVTERVSIGSFGEQGDRFSDTPSISSDGRFVAFTSHATNLVPGDTNGTLDVFVRDRATARTERVSVDSAGLQGNGVSAAPSISADGRRVAFQSMASNLVPGDTNYVQDVFVRHRADGLTERVSVDSAGGQANDLSGYSRISADGSVVLFGSAASNLVGGDTGGLVDVFVHECGTGVTQRVSVDSTGKQGNASSELWGSISADGMTVSFVSRASNLVPGDTNSDYDVVVHGRITGITERASVDSSGAQANSDSWEAVISADGRFVAIMSHATNLVPGDTNGSDDVFVRERCSTDATWTNYGAGYSGTLGVPSLVARVDPVIGTTVPIDLANSYGAATVGVVAIGLAEAFVPTKKGGNLLVAPSEWILVAIPPAGATIERDLPHDHALCDTELFAQAFELDPGAAKGFSFTPGLKLVLGH